jgi:hypothetical protein
VILAATGEQVTGGDYYGPRGLFELGGPPKKAWLSPVAKDPQLSKQLWRLSEAMTGARYLSEV